MNAKPKILVFIDWYLPGYKAGGPIRSCANMVDHLAEKFEFFIVTRDTDYCEDTPYQTVKSNSWQIAHNANVLYLSKDQISFSGIKKIINEIDFDIAYVNGVYSVFFSILPLYFLKNKKKKTVVATRGMLASSAISIKKTKKTLFIKTAKALNLYKNVVFQATNQQEKQDIKKVIGNNASVKVAPNFHQKKQVLQGEIKMKKSGELHLVSVARIAPEKNLLFALRTLSRVKEGDIYFDIYGPRYNQDYWEECEAVIKRLPENIKVNYKGSIDPEKLAAAFSKAHFLFLPSQGENFGHIILESFMHGCPVIISNQTPWVGLKDKNVGWEIELEEQLFAERITQCIGLNQEEYNKLQKGSSDYAQEVIQDKSTYDKNAQLFLNF